MQSIGKEENCGLYFFVFDLGSFTMVFYQCTSIFCCALLHFAPSLRLNDGMC